jgi:hypothetical protein
MAHKTDRGSNFDDWTQFVKAGARRLRIGGLKASCRRAANARFVGMDQGGTVHVALQVGRKSTRSDR